MNKTRVAINGYGVIGRPVAGADLLQPDTGLIGVADIITDWRIRGRGLDLPGAGVRHPVVHRCPWGNARAVGAWPGRPRFWSWF
ncbi:MULTISPECIES: hypothetical protein [unclassified Arthrobacter]|uniref:hypothetical protein n=1 Tax=unclassified Pseudarthrobacter TaxID=2647000 RepID=UPI003391F418